MDRIIQAQMCEELIIGDLNSQIGRNNNNHEWVHGVFGYDIGKGGKTVLDLPPHMFSYSKHVL